MKIVRKKLSPDELQSPSLRYVVDTDTVQTTPDGGTTWVDAPAQDPRTSPAFLLPPNAETDPQCVAAGGMVAYVKSFVDNAASGLTDVGMASSILGLLALLVPEIGLFAELIFAAADALIGIGGASIDSAFTSTVYDQLLCTFYANIGSDGQMDTAQGATILSAVAADYTATVDAVVTYLFGLIGNVGFSNAGAVATDTGVDCTICSEWCQQYNDTIGWGDWAAYLGDASFDGTNWTGVFSPPSDALLHIILHLPSPAEVVSIEVFCTDGGQVGAGTRIIYDLTNSTTLSGLGAPSTTWTGDVTTQDIVLAFDNNNSLGASYITGVVIKGLNPNPYVSSNCT